MSYGSYILRTGLGPIGRFELVMGRHYVSRDFPTGAPIMDLGPGRCWFTRQAPDRIVAVDIEPEIVAHYRAEGLQILAGSAYEVPFPDDHLDGVFCCWLFEHIPDLDRAMRELRRVMKPGALCLIIVPSANSRHFWDDYTHVRPFTIASLLQLAENNGFGEAQARYMPFMRGAMQVITYAGERAAARYLNISDRVLRGIGLVNRDNLELRCRKLAPTATAP
jgi:SAM-dependent methyltransferase